MTGAGLLALAAGAAAVAALWDLLAELDTARVGGWIGAATAPVVRAGEDGHALTSVERRRAAALAALVLAGCGWLLAGPAAAAAAALGAPAAVTAVVRARRHAFRASLATDVAPVARALADALAGGASIRSAVASCPNGLARGPAAAVLRETARALAAGEPTETALNRLRARAGSPAWDTLVAAILLQREAGGDLAGSLRDLASSLEAAERIERDARAATAQARFTAWLVGLLPAGGVAIAQLADPGFLGRVLAHPISVWLAAAAAMLQLAGIVAVRRLAR